MAPKQSPAPESLDDLMARAEHYANFSMRNMGRLPPTLFLVGPDGPLMFMPESLEDAAAKDDFATMAQLMCIAHGATACVLALEAWATFAKPGEKLDMTEAPSEAFDRREFVILMGESRSGHKQKYLPIIRSGNGKFFGFGESEDPGADDIRGRFAQLLPPKVPDAAMRVVARAMLKVKGIATALRGSSPRLPRSRRRQPTSPSSKLSGRTGKMAAGGIEMRTAQEAHRGGASGTGWTVEHDAVMERKIFG